VPSQPPTDKGEGVDILDQKLAFRINVVDLTYDELMAVLEVLPPVAKLALAGTILGLAAYGVKKLLY